MSINLDNVIGIFNESIYKLKEKNDSKKLTLFKKIEVVAFLIKVSIIPGVAIGASISLITFSITPLAIGLGIGSLGYLALRVANYASNNLIDNIKTYNEIKIVTGYFKYRREYSDDSKEYIQRTVKRIIKDYQKKCTELQNNGVKVNSISWKCRSFIGNKAIRLLDFLEAGKIDHLDKMLKILEQNIS